MNSYDKLSTLTLTQLEVLLSHAKMGVAHLKKYLTPFQIKYLLEINKFPTQQKATIVSDKFELHGNIVPLVNTIFTSILGGSLGFSAFSNFDMVTVPILLGLSALIAVSSAILAGTSYHLTKEKGGNAIAQQKITFLQISLFKIINHKLEKSISVLVNSLNKMLHDIESYCLDLHLPKIAPLSLNEFKSKEKMDGWLAELNSILNTIKKNKKLNLKFDESLGFSQIIDKVQKLINKPQWLNDLIGFSSHLQPEQIVDPVEKKGEKKEENLFSILNRLYNGQPNELTEKKIWWKEKYQDITVGLFPTLLGGSASLFVFFNGIPDILKKLNFDFLHGFITSPFAKKIELSIFFGITCYFGFIYLYTQKKIFQRNHSLTVSQQVIKNQEVLRLELRHKRDSLRKLVFLFEKLNLLLKIAK